MIHIAVACASAYKTTIYTCLCIHMESEPFSFMFASLAVNVAFYVSSSFCIFLFVLMLLLLVYLLVNFVSRLHRFFTLQTFAKCSWSIFCQYGKIPSQKSCASASNQRARMIAFVGVYKKYL